MRPTLPGLPTDVEEAKIFLKQITDANPNDMLAVGVTQTIRSYEKLLRD